MKKRLLSLLLVLCLILSLSAPVLADNSRDTNYFKPIAHSDMDLADMPRELVELQTVQDTADRARALISDSANLAKVKALVEETIALYKKAYTAESLAYYSMSSDISDDDAAALYQEASNRSIRIQNILFLLIHDVLFSPCAGALNDLVRASDRAYFLNYKGLSDEDLALSDRDTELTNAFLQDPDSWEGIFLEMVRTRNSIAVSYGYDNYYSYAYPEVYGRDYSPQELDGFRKAVKDKIVPIFIRLDSEIWREMRRPVFERDYTGGPAFELIEPCLADMSDELLESFRYLRAHGLIDDSYSYKKTDSTFTAPLPSYNSAYILIDPYLDFYDFTTVIHEFGHFNNYYWTPVEWDGTEKTLDVDEVHSQALELLFLHYYPELFGEDARAAQLYIIYQRLYTIIEALINDSLERYIYSAKDLTIDGINREYVRLQKEYGLLSADSPIREDDAWADIVHFFIAPCYYISYGVSIAGAWDFWIDSQKDFYAAVDRYLQFTALDNFTGYKESFRAVGMDQPLTAQMVDRLASTIEAFLNQGSAGTDVRYVGPFKDVKESDWFAEAVEFVYDYDLMSGTSKTTFSPNGDLTRAQLVTILWRLEGEPDAQPGTFSDVPDGKWYSEAIGWAQEYEIAAGYKDGRFGPNDKITREQLAAILYRYVGLYDLGFSGLWTYKLEYADKDAISAWAKEAVSWMSMKGVLSGKEQNRIAPKETATRAQAASMIMRLVAVIVDALESEEDELFQAILREHGLLSPAA